MPRLALYTFGVLKDVTGSAILTDFVTMAPSVFAAANTVDGFIAHAGDARPDLAGKSKFGEDFGPWGIAVAPHFYKGSTKPGEDTMITTLSLWRDIEAARRFVYGGLHRAALRRRSEWFQNPSGRAMCSGGSPTKRYPPGSRARASSKPSMTMGQPTQALILRHALTRTGGKSALATLG